MNFKNLTYYVAFASIVLTALNGLLSFAQGLNAIRRNEIAKQKLLLGFMVGKLIRGVATFGVSIVLLNFLLHSGFSPWIPLVVIWLYGVADHFCGVHIEKTTEIKLGS